MLHELAVRDLGVISSLSQTFGEGMTALTGETGAGKTMIVEAIGLLLGARSDPRRVRPGAEEAVVEGRFVAAGSPDGAGEHVLRRVVAASGRSRAYIDGRLATAGELAEMAANLIEVHGQHAQQSLTSRAAQRDALDRFGHIDLGPWREATVALGELCREREALGGDPRARVREIELLRYQLDEIDRAEISDSDEDDRLRAEADLLGDALGHRSIAVDATDALDGEGGVLDQLRTIADTLSRSAPFTDTSAVIEGFAAELGDVSRALRRRVDDIEDDPERLAAVQERRAVFSDLRRKYGDTLAEVIAEGERLHDELAALEAAEVRGAALDGEIAAAEAKVMDEAALVGAARRRCAPKLAAAIVEHLRPLGMPHARVLVAVGSPGEDTVSSAGDVAGDDVELLFAPDRNGAEQPLARIASGGELSRTMLAVHLALSAGPPTMVFDEVDAGIGGATATDVGRALAALADQRQVIVVTHLPQVAAFADHQVAVAKSDAGGITTSSTVLLDSDERVIELSRMMSGSPDSDAARQHAEELLAAAGAERGTR